MMKTVPLALFPATTALFLLLAGCVDSGYYGYASGGGSPPSIVVGDAPVVIAPLYINGYGNGYWYGGQFWPYRTGCSFYNGRYYGGQGWSGGSGGNSGAGRSYTHTTQNNYNVQANRTVQSNSYNQASHSPQYRHASSSNSVSRPGNAPQGHTHSQGKGNGEKKHTQ